MSNNDPPFFVSEVMTFVFVFDLEQKKKCFRVSTP